MEEEIFSYGLIRIKQQQQQQQRGLDLTWRRWIAAVGGCVNLRNLVLFFFLTTFST